MSPAVAIMWVSDRLPETFDGLGNVATPVSWAGMAGALEPGFQDCRVAPSEALCLFLDLKPRGRYVMWHSWGRPLRRHCEQGAVPLHFFLLSLQNEQAVQRKKIQVSKSRLTSTTKKSLYTHPLPLSGVDSRGLSVAACYCGCTHTCDEDRKKGISHRTPHGMECTYSSTSPWRSLLYRSKQSHGAYHSIATVI